MLVKLANALREGASAHVSSRPPPCKGDLAGAPTDGAQRRLSIRGKLTLACTGALFCAGVNAQTSVTLYGIADGALRVDHTNIGTLKELGSGGYLQSRWGLRGSEDLGDGLKATFNFEQGFDLSDNSSSPIAGATPTTPTSSTGSRLFSRTATVGLSSTTFGTLRLGRDITSPWVVTLTADPFTGSTVGQAANIAIPSKVTSRYDNGVYYDTPTFAGLRVAVQGALGESSTDTTPGTPKNAGNKFGGGVFYTAGPLYVAYAYSNNKAGVTSPLISNTVNHTRLNALGATYDFGIFKLHGLAYSGKDSLGFNVRSGLIGTSVPFGAWTFIASIDHINDMGASNPAAPTVRTNYDASFIGAAATYSFSKRTVAYVAGGGWKVRNPNGGSYGVTDANATNGLFTAANLFGVRSPWAAQIGIDQQF